MWSGYVLMLDCMKWTCLMLECVKWICFNARVCDVENFNTRTCDMEMFNARIRDVGISINVWYFIYDENVQCYEWELTNYWYIEKDRYVWGLYNICITIV